MRKYQLSLRRAAMTLLFFPLSVSIQTLSFTLPLTSLYQLHAASVQSFTDADLKQELRRLKQEPPIPSMPITRESSSSNDSKDPPAAFKYPSLTLEQTKQVNQEINIRVKEAEHFMQNQWRVVQDKTRMPMSIDKVQLENAITNLEVKKTLAAKFINSPSLKSPKVREILIQVLSKDLIQASDLAALQNIVDRERPYTYP
ncbi:hypothetical protein [Neochlamydia sp. TUME1]|uniref:hypothetical protein n=1 Tax=Neochlamydia sp. TUME1 TaxID=1478174 RepID=UPI00068BA7FF|nr:hypothetical protein [Neochlamydia sp. TUME1]